MKKVILLAKIFAKNGTYLVIFAKFFVKTKFLNI
jgi:hypothetical protein